MKLLIQDYLETHTFTQLAEEHGVYASFNREGYKFSLNYDQIESKESDPLACQCRGLILGMEESLLPKAEINQYNKPVYNKLCPGKTQILSYGMDRFFNYGQGPTQDFNWNDSNIEVLEKLDGTCIFLYWDSFASRWCTGTRSSPDADIMLDGGEYTFSSLFAFALKSSLNMGLEDLIPNLIQTRTYVFELTTVFNQVIVLYPDPFVTLIAVRDLETLKEIRPQEVTEIPASILRAPSYPLTTINELVDFVGARSPSKHEGVIVKDSQFNRIKVKSAAYAAFNRIGHSLSSPRACMELILHEKDDDIIPMMPSLIAERLIKIKTGFVAMLKAHEAHYAKSLAEANAIAPGDKKTFAKIISVDKTMYQAAFFKMFEGKVSSVKEFIQTNKKQGSWSNSFLDHMLELSEKFG